MATRINDQTIESAPTVDALIPIANDIAGGAVGRSTTWENMNKVWFVFQRDVILVTETVTIDADHQLIVAGPLTNNGTLVNNGRLVVI